MNASSDIRPSPIAGQWYSGDPARLAASVDGYIQAARLPEIQGEVVGVIAPHAGHRYSGPVAGYAFAALRGLQPDLVAVLAPMHFPAAPALLTSAHQAYQTPLGAVENDRQALEALEAHLQAAGLSLAPVRRDPEHSLEIELPFLQRVFPQGFKLLPVMVRDPSEGVARGLGAALALALAGRNALIVASSDLSHFYPQRVAAVLDGELLRRVAAFDPLAVLQAEEEGVGFACGRGALAAALWVAQGLGADRVQILYYATSGDVTGDTSQVVGYAAAAITRPLAA
ncbi:MAG: AmmeMemoRadiSam system protein B [Chloroflexi bacterium]|nr:AmmeMemoRadiSam system protein B [Chloroflexota bacterium]